MLGKTFGENNNIQTDKRPISHCDVQMPTNLLFDIRKL